MMIFIIYFLEVSLVVVQTHRLEAKEQVEGIYLQVLSLGCYDKLRIQLER